MNRIPVDVSAFASVMLIQAPAERVNKDSGVVLTDRQTGKVQWNLNVAVIVDDKPYTLAITVLDDGFPHDLTPGAQLNLVGLTASPWSRENDGRTFTGIAYRAAMVTLADTAKVKAAA